MSDAAQPTPHPSSRLLQQVRSSYGRGTVPFGQAAMPAPPVVSVPTPDIMAAPANPPPNSITEQLAVLDQVLTQVETQAAAQQPPAPVVTPTAQVAQPPAPVATPTVDPSMAAAIPLAVDQATNTLNPVQPVGTTAKEAVVTLPEQPKVDAASGMQVVEYEPTPEISPEVASYLQKVEENQDQLPQEIVITGDATQLVSPAPTLRPVIVLPITPEIEAAGAKKSPQWSIRWLVEWSRRLMKAFSGKILYAEETS